MIRNLDYDHFGASSILITGGSGYFGQAAIRYLMTQWWAKRICIYSRSEFAQATLRSQIADPNEILRWFIGDVRDLPRLRQAMEGVDLVIHAAALKRIEVGHYNPCEMVKTNIGGAMNVIDAATSANVKWVVALSSDKAYQPVSPYGQSKALAESLFLNANNTRGASGPRYAVVRYGNVAGSTGSVIPKWRALLADKTGNSAQAVPITDPECTRFWMTVGEAVDLVMHTAANMEGGELVIPDLPAYRLHDLAVAMGAKATQITGLPPHEKRHEAMSDDRSSASARRMSIEELQTALKEV